MVLHVLLNHILVLLGRVLGLFGEFLQAFLRVLALDVRIDGFALRSHAAWLVLVV